MAAVFSFKSFNELTVEELYKILKARQEVFQMEQEIRYVDCDDVDLHCHHLCLWSDSNDSKELIAYLRLLPIGKYRFPGVGRVLTHKKYRGKGHGKQLMNYLVKTVAKENNFPGISMSAQAYLEKFYQDFGFKTESEIYMEEGIEHIEMSLDLKGQS